VVLSRLTADSPVGHDKPLLANYMPKGLFGHMLTDMFWTAISHDVLGFFFILPLPSLSHSKRTHKFY
jgi:hypothetical protein